MSTKTKAVTGEGNAPREKQTAEWLNENCTPFGRQARERVHTHSYSCETGKCVECGKTYRVVMAEQRAERAEQQRDELLSACKSGLEFCRYIIEDNAEPSLEETAATRDTLRAAIANAERKL